MLALELAGRHAADGAEQLVHGSGATPKRSSMSRASPSGVAQRVALALGRHTAAAGRAIASGRPRASPAERSGGWARGGARAGFRRSRLACVRRRRRLERLRVGKLYAPSNGSVETVPWTELRTASARGGARPRPFRRPPQRLANPKVDADSPARRAAAAVRGTARRLADAAEVDCAWRRIFPTSLTWCCTPPPRPRRRHRSLSLYAAACARSALRSALSAPPGGGQSGEKGNRLKDAPSGFPT